MEIYLAFFAIIFILWIIWRKQHLSIFKKLGVPGPKPNLLFGNILELYQKAPIQCHEDWTKKYGRVLGYFYGMKPVLLITDPSILKTIYIKDFNKFINREAFNPIFKYDPHNKDAQSVLNLPGRMWKDVRSVLTPTFTAAKMKQMAGSMNSSIETMMKIIKERAEKGEVFDAFDTYQRMTMDVITRTAFGVRTDIQTNHRSKLLKATKLLFSTNYRDPIIFLGLTFPYLQWICRKMQMLVLTVLNRGTKPDRVLRKGLIKVLDYRRENPQGSKTDLLQLMIDSKIYTDTKDVDTKHLEIGIADYEAKFNKEEDSNKAFRKMADYEIVSTSVTVLLAGYETTSTALAFTTYLLGKHREVQEKLYNEILEAVQNGQQLDYTTINKLQYLDKVLNESMRIYPPVVFFTNRYAVEDVQYGDLKIPKGTLIQAPVYLLHHDPEFWDEPEKFDPERFNEKTNVNGITYLPFGVGPRNCLGMRFAQIEAKLTLAHVVYKFRISVTDSQKGNSGVNYGSRELASRIWCIGVKEKLTLIQRIRTLAPENGIRVKMELRDPEGK